MAGTYNAASGDISLVPGQGLQSRTANYSQPATDAARSTLIFPGILGLSGNNTLENMIVGGSVGTKVAVQGSNNVIRGSQIGLPGDVINIGLINFSDNNLLIDNANISIGGNTGIQSGIAGLASTNTTVQNSNVTVTSAAAGPIVVILANGAATIILNGVNLQGTGSQQVLGISPAGSGGRISATDTMVVVNSQVGAAGLAANDGNQIEFFGGSIDVTGSPGLIRTTTGQITITDSVCTVNGSSVACG